MQTSASKSCAIAISSIESAITSRDTSDARMPGVPCDWLSETAIVLNGSATPPAASTAAAAASDSSRWLRLHGIVPVQVEAIPTIGPSSRAGSIPIERKCARAPARAGSSRSGCCDMAGSLLTHGAPSSGAAAASAAWICSTRARSASPACSTTAPAQVPAARHGGGTGRRSSSAAAWAAAPSATSSVGVGHRDRPPRQPRQRAPPGRALRAAADQRPAARSASTCAARGGDRGEGARAASTAAPSYAACRIAPGARVVAQPERRARGVRQVRRALAVEVRQHDHLAGRLDGLAVEPEQRGDPVDGERAVERAGERQEAARGVGEARPRCRSRRAPARLEAT